MPTATIPISETLRTMLVRLNSVRNVSVASENATNRRSPAMQDREVALGEKLAKSRARRRRSLVDVIARQRGGEHVLAVVAAHLRSLG